jgi:phospholipase C
VKSVVDAVMSKPQIWNRCVIIITWDDWGGFYDHVPPPSGYGFRVPALIVSPFAKKGFIDHTFYSFESTLKLIEWRYNIAPLTDRDAQANNILNALDLPGAAGVEQLLHAITTKPRPPPANIPKPTNALITAYQSVPMPAWTVAD